MSPEEIRAVKFFWSVRRQRYWKQCRRRYFLHYYLARIGRNEEADADCREAFELDRRVSAQAFVRIMICKSMHTMFQNGEHGSIADDAVLRFRHEVNKMLRFPDSMPAVVSELIDGKIPVRDTADRLTAEIRRAGELVDANFWSKIQYVPREMRRYVDSPQRVNFLELACYFVPVVLFSMHGELWFLEGCGTADAGNMISCLHRMYACNELGRDPVNVRSLYLDDRYELKQLDDLVSVSACLEEIRTDIDAMVKAEMEGYVTLRDFPAAPGELCQNCQFFKFCSKRGTFAQKS